MNKDLSGHKNNTKNIFICFFMDVYHNYFYF